MNGLPYYKAYPRDFIEGTIGMPFEVKCAYRVVLDLIYMQGGNLPDDARYISGLLGCSIRKWKSIRETLIAVEKLQVSGGFLTNKRARNELETLAKLQDKMSENARHPRKNNDLEKQKQSHTEPEPEPYKDTQSKDCDADASFWDFSSQILKKSGISDRQARSLLGKWTKARGRDDVRAMVEAAKDAADPVTVCTAAMQPPKEADRLTFCVDAIKSGKRFLCTNISANLARSAIAEGRLTEEECRKVGVL